MATVPATSPSKRTSKQCTTSSAQLATPHAVRQREIAPMSSGYKSVLAAVAAVTFPSAYAHRFRQAEPAQLQRSHHAAERTEARGSRPTAPQSCHKIPDAPAASCIGLQRSGFCEPHTTLHPLSPLKKRAALPVPPWQPATKRASITLHTSQTPQITTVETVRQACKDICAQTRAWLEPQLPQR